jgi:Leucine-rich repeat (LRR) protein
MNIQPLLEKWNDTYCNEEKVQTTLRIPFSEHARLRALEKTYQFTNMNTIITDIIKTGLDEIIDSLSDKVPPMEALEYEMKIKAHPAMMAYCAQKPMSDKERFKSILGGKRMGSFGGRGDLEESVSTLEVEEPIPTVVEEIEVMLQTSPDWLDELIAWADKCDLPEFSIPRDREKILAMESLHISMYASIELPDSIGNLTNLKKLQLAEIGLTEVPASIGNLTNLTELDLSDNKLTVVPESIGNLTNLIELYLGYNQISELPESIGNLKNLNVLRLQSNNFLYIPEFIGDFHHLTELGLDLNDKQPSEFLGNLTNLTNLELNFDGEKLPEFVGKLTNLKRFRLRANRLSEIPECVSDFLNLTEFELCLLGNNLTEIPEFISNLKNLTSLDLRCNQLTEIPEFVANLPNLQKLDLRGNPLTSLPRKIDVKGIAIFGYDINYGIGRNEYPSDFSFTGLPELEYPQSMSVHPTISDYSDYYDEQNEPEYLSDGVWLYPDGSTRDDKR